MWEVDDLAYSLFRCRWPGAKREPERRADIEIRPYGKMGLSCEAPVSAGGTHDLPQRAASLHQTPGERQRKAALVHSFPAPSPHRSRYEETGLFAGSVRRRDDGAIDARQTASHDPRTHERATRMGRPFVIAFFSFGPAAARKVNCPEGAREAPLEGSLFGKKRKWGADPRRTPAPPEGGSPRDLPPPPAGAGPDVSAPAPPGPPPGQSKTRRRPRAPRRPPPAPCRQPPPSGSLSESEGWRR